MGSVAGWDGNETWLWWQEVVLGVHFQSSSIPFLRLLSSASANVAGLILPRRGLRVPRQNTRVALVWAPTLGGSLVAAFMQGNEVGAL